MDELRHAPGLLGRGRQGPEEARRLALMAARSGEPYLAVTLMQNLKATGTFPYSMRWNHPLVYSGDVLAAYRLYGLPPQLTLSVIRSESAFQAGAVSRSNARGLMQLLPSTAARLQGMLGDGEIKEEDLFDRGLNIRLGTYYLSLLYDSFKSIPLSIAAYNGGPFNVMSFIRAREGMPMDLFIETFPFTETSTYVRAVLLSVYSYESAYLGEGRLPDLTSKVSLPEKAPPDF
jgi:soluble lytic murein transglycosylase